MRKLKYKILFSLLGSLLINMVCCFAQQKIELANAKGKSNGNTTIEKGAGIGISVNTKKDTVRLQEVELNLIGEHPDTISYYLRIFPLENKLLSANIGPEKLYVQSLAQGKISIDLKDEEIDLNGAYVIGLEWAKKPVSAIKMLGFSTSVFKKGIYVKDRDEADWKKFPFLGFNLHVVGVKN